MSEILSEEEVTRLRDRRGLAWDCRNALCKSHEALRAEVERLRKDDLRNWDGQEYELQDVGFGECPCMLVDANVVVVLRPKADREEG